MRWADDPQKLDEAVLDYHLNRLEEAEKDRLESLLAASPQLASRDRTLRRLCEALDGWPAPEPPADLVGRVVAAVEARTATGDRVLPFEPAPAEVSRGEVGSRPSFLSVREIVAVAACLAIIVGMVMPGHKWARERARRTYCQSNLQSIMAGLGGYQAAYAGAVPFAGPSKPGTMWLRQAPAGVPRDSNTRHFYLLVRGYFVQPSKFYCPSRPDGVPMAQVNGARFPDFPERANCNYSMQNFVGPKPSCGSDPRLVIMGDTNPLFDPAALRLAGTYPENSFSHQGGAGQNVLRLGGNIQWTAVPTVGVDGDHIYLAGDRTRYQGTERPVCATDSFLIP